jgi:hypothetical protein
MTEAWLFVNESAIREAAGNPNGRMDLELPPLQTIERMPDPKARLCEALRVATGLGRRRLDSFHERSAIQRVASLIGDFSDLRCLPAFQRLEADLRHLLPRL